MIDGCADGADAVALNEDFAGAEDCACVNLQEARGVEHDRGGCGLLREDSGSEDEARETPLEVWMREESEHGYDYSNSWHCGTEQCAGYIINALIDWRRR